MMEFDANGTPIVRQFKHLNKILIMPDEFKFLFSAPRDPHVILKQAKPGIMVLYDLTTQPGEPDWAQAHSRPGVYVVTQVILEQHIFLELYCGDHQTTVPWYNIDWNGFKVVFK